MRIITCIKQVPASSSVKVDPKTGVLIRDGKNVKMNPYDLYALEIGFLLKDTQTHAITMGPPSAISVLKEALYMGADEATLISDFRFAGADVLATSYTLSQLIKHIKEYDLIICGKQTTDGDTAQVGPEIASFLNIEHVAYVKEIVEVKDGFITLKSTYDHYDEIVKAKLPVLITVDQGANVPRLPSYKRKMSFKDIQVKTISLSHLEDQDPTHYGLMGSPTQVEEIFPPESTQTSIKIEGDYKKLAQSIMDILKENRFV